MKKSELKAIISEEVKKVLTEKSRIIKPFRAASIGERAEDYNGNKGKIVAKGTVGGWKALQKYDESGWMDPQELKRMGLRSSDPLVAFKDSHGDTNVFTYGDDGVAVYLAED